VVLLSPGSKHPPEEQDNSVITWLQWGIGRGATRANHP
jgi:hypothetical protein